MYQLLSHGSYQGFVLERIASRPTILELTILEPIIAVAYIVLVAYLLRQLTFNGIKTLVTKNVWVGNLNKTPAKPNAITGFTIIEVLIVLAIAALILLIVFLAVPALQRQQRNTGRKSEAARASASVVDFISNNNGGLPTTQPNCQTIVNSWGFGTTSQYSTLTGNVCPVANVTNTLRIAVGSIVANNVYLYNGAGGATGTVAAAQSQVMYIVDNSTCNGNDTVQPGTVGRSVAFLYTLEAGNGNSWACITANG